METKGKGNKVDLVERITSNCERDASGYRDTVYDEDRNDTPENNSDDTITEENKTLEETAATKEARPDRKGRNKPHT